MFLQEESEVADECHWQDGGGTVGVIKLQRR